MPKTPRLGHELRQAGRFGLVGIAATLLHLVTSQGALYAGGSALAANLAGFIVAFIFGLFAHMIYTFPGTASFGRALRRYGVIAVTGFAVNNLVLISLVTSQWLSEAAALTCAVLIVPAGTFLASRFWGFAPQQNRPIGENNLDQGADR